MKKKIIALLLCTVMALGLMACGNDTAAKDDAKSNDAKDSAAENDGTAANASYTIRIGMPTGGKHFQNYTAEQFKEAVEKATDGDIAVQIYPSSQLGTTTQMIQGVQDSSIEAVIIPSSYLAPFAPATAVTDIPYFFEDCDQIYNILNEDSNPLNSYLEKFGFKVAGWLKNTPRYILSQKKYEALKDMSNQKIWCLPSTTLQDELTAYSAAPQTLDPSDISVSLDNGTVDGVETDVIFMNSMGLGESAGYLNQIPATPMVNLFCFSYDWFTTLPEDYQTLLTETALDVIRSKEADYVDDSYEKSLNGLKENGVEVVPAEESLVTEMKKAAESVKETFKETDKDCAAIYEELEKMIKKDNGN